MSASYTNETVVVNYRDAFPKAMVKNVIVVVLCISINYINVALLQTFCKQQVWHFFNHMELKKMCATITFFFLFEEVVGLFCVFVYLFFFYQCYSKQYGWCIIQQVLVPLFTHFSNVSTNCFYFSLLLCDFLPIL